MSNRVIGGCMIAAGAMLSLTALGGGLCVGILAYAGGTGGGAQNSGLLAGLVIFGLLIALSVGLIIGGFKVEKQGRNEGDTPIDRGPEQ